MLKCNSPGIVRNTIIEIEWIGVLCIILFPGYLLLRAFKKYLKNNR